MKSEHRHELKTNELAEWMANLPQWARENRTTIIVILAAIVLSGAFYIWRIHQKKAAVQTQTELTRLLSELLGSKMQILSAQDQGRPDPSYMLIQRGGPADKLRDFAQKVNDDHMAALALIKQAEILRLELHCRQETVSKQDLMTQINQARASYTEAIENHLNRVSNPLLTATAQFGLGLCEEELGNFEKAQQIYQDITTNPDIEGTTAKVAAENRLKAMADYKTKIAFKPSPKPKPADIEKSPIEIKLADTNLPTDTNQAPQAPNIAPDAPDINSSPQVPNIPTDVNLEPNLR